MFEELSRHASMGGSQECPNCYACKESIEHVLFECASYDFQRLISFNCLKKVLPRLLSKPFFMVGLSINCVLLGRKARYMNVALNTIE